MGRSADQLVALPDLQAAIRARRTDEGPLDEVASAFMRCPRVNACLRSAFSAVGGEYEQLDDAKSELWMLLQTRLLNELSDADKTYSLIYGVALNLAARSAVLKRRNQRDVSFNAAEGRAAEADDFAAIGDHLAPELMAIEDHSFELHVDELTNAPLRRAFAEKLARVGLSMARHESKSRRENPSKQSRQTKSVAATSKRVPRFSSAPDRLQQKLIDLSTVTGAPRKDLNVYLCLPETLWNSICRKRIEWASLTVSDRRVINSTLSDRNTGAIRAEVRFVKRRTTGQLLASWARQCGYSVVDSEARRAIARLIDRSVSALYAWERERPAEYVLVMAHRRITAGSK